MKLPPTALPLRERVRLWAGAAALFLAACGILCPTAGDVGLTWDEVPYRDSQLKMAHWFDRLKECSSAEELRQVLGKEAVLGDWQYNRYGPNFHPPLAGILCNLTYALFGGFIDEVAARRLASSVLLALAAAALFLFLARRYGSWVGGVAAISLVLMPRVFGHAHIAGTDMPLMAFWAFVVLAFWNGLYSRTWRLAFGVLLGLAFLVKFSAILVIVPLVVWLVLYRGLSGLSARSAWAVIGSTALIGWPLALAGAEIVRLDPLIRVKTQERMLRYVLGRTEPESTLEEIIGHSGPFSDRDLKQATALIALKLPAKRPEGISEQDWDLLRRALDLDSYIKYVNVAGLGVESRFSSWLFFVPLALWMLWSALGWLRGFPAPQTGLQLWLAGLALAPVVAIALNPTWWHDTLPQLAHYYQISVGRQSALPDIEIFYLGNKYIYSLPWHNGWVLIAVTVPTAILALALVGSGTALVYWRRDSLRMLFLLNMVAFPVTRMLPTPAHDGVRLMLPTFFFLAAMAGWGFQVIERLAQRWRLEEYSTAPLLVVIASFLLLPPAYWLWRTHPYELSYYNGLVRGLPRAQRLGFETTYWYDAVTPDVLRVLNDSKAGLPPQAAFTLPEPRSIVQYTSLPQVQHTELVQSLPEPRINPDVFYGLREMGKLRSDIRFYAPFATGFPYVPLLTHSSKSSPYTRLLYALKPHASWEHAGVRLFSLYGPRAVARAWALWLLLDDSDYSPRPIKPHADSDLLKLARGNYRSLYAAAVRITEHGLERALQADEDPETMAVIWRLAAREGSLEILLTRRKDALVEAAEIISQCAAERPGLLERLIEYEGYLPNDELGEYLDAKLNGPDA